MNQDYKGSEDLFDLSIDELIAEAKAQIGDVTPVKESVTPSAQEIPATPTQDSRYAEQAPSEFELDFGNAFDDYGEYVAPGGEEER